MKSRNFNYQFLLYIFSQKRRFRKTNDLHRKEVICFSVLNLSVRHPIPQSGTGSVIHFKQCSHASIRSINKPSNMLSLVNASHPFRFSRLKVIQTFIHHDGNSRSPLLFCCLSQLLCICCTNNQLSTPTEYGISVLITACIFESNFLPTLNIAALEFFPA